MEQKDKPQTPPETATAAIGALMRANHIIGVDSTGAVVYTSGGLFKKR